MTEPAFSDEDIAALARSMTNVSSIKAGKKHAMRLLSARDGAFRAAHAERPTQLDMALLIRFLWDTAEGDSNLGELERFAIKTAGTHLAHNTLRNTKSLGPAQTQWRNWVFAGLARTEMAAGKNRDQAYAAVCDRFQYEFEIDTVEKAYKTYASGGQLVDEAARLIDGQPQFEFILTHLEDTLWDQETFARFLATLMAPDLPAQLRALID